MSAGTAQPQTESLPDGVHNTELEAWEKEFAPLNAGFCDFLSVWNKIKAPVPVPPAASSVPLTGDVPPVSASLPPTITYNFNFDAVDHAQAFPSQDPSLLSIPDFLDPSFPFTFDVPGQQYDQLYDPLQALPPSAVWPKALNPFGTQM